MASVFLSYDRDDADKARPIAAALEKAGHSVWWDRHIKSGSQYSKAIEKALNEADAVVVLWSSHSVESAWVRDEAAAGRDSERLVPVTLDKTPPPLGFRQYQTIDMSRWKARGAPPEMKTLLADVEAMRASRASEPVPAAKPIPSGDRRETRRSAPWTIIGLAAGLLLLAVVLLFVRPWRTGSAMPAASVVAADNSSLSRSMAHNVLVNLGSVAGKSAANFRLLDEGNHARPAFRVSVSGAGQGGKVQATVALSSDKDGVLWSRQSEQPANLRADLEESIALAAMAALTCASDDPSHASSALSSNEFRAYLGACVSLDEGAEVEPLVAVFRRTTDVAPRFAGAWANLLLAEAAQLQSLQGQGESNGALRTAIAKDIESARKIDPGMAETAIAEEELQAPNAFLQRASIIDAARSAHPNDPEVLSQRATLMFDVGRLDEALDNARRASELKPYSAAFRANYLTIWASTGGIDKVWGELSNAKRLWPDASAIQDVDNSINMRFGDFEKTWRAAGLPIDGGITGYFKILKDPTDANIDAWISLAKTHKMEPGHRYFLLQALGPLKRVDQLYEFLDQWPMEHDLAGVTYVLFRPWTANVRRDPRFMRLAQRVGLLDYWRKSGSWPDFCAEPDMPYDCKKEAAKLPA
jgi:tetratricopeptide (TPR) repeat protein